jgi:hypothetical protein
MAVTDATQPGADTSRYLLGAARGTVAVSRPLISILARDDPGCPVPRRRHLRRRPNADLALTAPWGADA